MFKRAAKRERKREKEEELGLDEDMKQVLGLQDTDSDESLESSSESEFDDRSDVGADTGDEIDVEDADITSHLSHKRKRSTQSLGSLLSDEDGPPMNVMAATTDPIYDLPNSPQALDLRACIICPGKVIKNPKMAIVHLESSAHRRRLERYTAEVTKRAFSREGLNTDDPRDILRDMPGTLSHGAQLSTSKRSQRRNEWKQKQAERRRTQKERRKIAVDKSKET